jgi:polysaccharide biosynthesis/export protein
MRSSTTTTLLCSIALAAILAGTAGCTSWFQPRSHKLSDTAERFSKSAVCPAPLPHELTEQFLPEYRVVTGDVILIEPADFDSTVRLPGDQEVENDGTIQLGQYGQLHVAGLTLAEIRGEAEQILTREAERKVPLTARLVEKKGEVYYVLGEVGSPGIYAIEGHETVLDAIIKAGGITDQADRTGIILTKPTLPCECRVVLPICYRHIVQLGDTSTNYQMEPGDRIFVPSSSFWDGLGEILFPEGSQCPKCGPTQEACPSGAPIRRRHGISTMTVSEMPTEAE